MTGDPRAPCPKRGRYGCDCLPCRIVDTYINRLGWSERKAWEMLGGFLDSPLVVPREGGHDQ